MPTNDERREVAARLREFADTGAYASKETMSLVGALLFVTGVDATRGTSEDIMRGLADLIEPEPERTCEIEFDLPQEVGFKQIDCRCSECWHGMSVHDHFCSECGAKVIN